MVFDTFEKVYQLFSFSPVLAKNMLNFLLDTDFMEKDRLEEMRLCKAEPKFDSNNADTHISQDYIELSITKGSRKFYIKIIPEFMKDSFCAKTRITMAEEPDAPPIRQAVLLTEIMSFSGKYKLRKISQFENPSSMIHILSRAVYDSMGAGLYIVLPMFLELFLNKINIEILNREQRGKLTKVEIKTMDEEMDYYAFEALFFMKAGLSGVREEVKRGFLRKEEEDKIVGILSDMMWRIINKLEGNNKGQVKFFKAIMAEHGRRSENL